MTIITSNDPTAAAPANGLLGAALNASESALRGNDVPRALAIINDYLAKTDKVTDVQKGKIRGQISRVKVKAGLNNSLSAECHMTLGRLYYKAKNIGAAIEEFEDAAKFDPKNGCAPLALGIIYENIVRYQKAIGYYNQAIEINRTAAGENNARCAAQAVNNLERVSKLLVERLQLMTQPTKNP